ncbi:hypothetical protein HO133_001812 [Letharia lupina]|uniref:Homeobox domain-containing protein n=1 Tax=Letharia lupina TaxID=560253 RepID=A0A8H6CEN5_9LECA|nr:uncharacterized protein HO133_001812 [Letharia lupina]KAF6221844.1 hypothetical protein HO133_001812 [Letharia lupina]
MDLQASLFGGKCANVLPSPPESPSMYAYPALGEHGRYTTRLPSRRVLPSPTGGATFRSAEDRRQACDEKGSPSQSYENPPRDERTPPHSSSLHQVTTVEDNSSVSSNLRTPELPSPDQVSCHLRKEDTLKQRPTRASSAASHPTPQLVLTEAEHQSEDDELFTGSKEEEDIAGGKEAVKSGTERLAEKRKMKRFRLTHAQTRYLMSEFSRHAHPDAAQRERLSRDIPGLNPRQVQVWFQNRRAKLRRLTTDDQERMRRSRALPENFDFSQTLQPSFREPRFSYASTMTEPLMLGGGMSQRPSLRLGIGHLSTASSSMNSNFTTHAPSPVSATGSAGPSPVSSINEGSERSGPYFSATQSPLVTSPQFTNPFGRSLSLSAGSSAFQRLDRPSNQNSMMEIGGQSITTTSPSSSSLASTTYGYENLPPLQFSRNQFQTRNGQRFGRVQTTDGLSHESGMAMDQRCISQQSSPNTLSYDQSHMLYPSGSGYRPSSYYQSPDTNFWHGSQMCAQGYPYGQQLPPHQTSEERPGSPPSQSSLSQDASVNRYDPRSYSHSDQYYNKSSSSAQEMSTESDAQAQPRTVGEEEVATGANRQPASDIARPRARSDTFPTYYNAQ